MDIHNSVMDIHDLIMDIHNLIMDVLIWIMDISIITGLCAFGSPYKIATSSWLNQSSVLRNSSERPWHFINASLKHAICVPDNELHGNQNGDGNWGRVGLAH